MYVSKMGDMIVFLGKLIFVFHLGRLPCKPLTPLEEMNINS